MADIHYSNSGGVGPQGAPGSVGNQGTNGSQGIQGLQGTQGLQGPTGLQGALGLQGLIGSGAQGAQGTTGLQGLLGLQGTQGLQGTSASLPTYITYAPVWSGTGLAYTGSPALGYYIANGSNVQVSIKIDTATVTNFGTGQYSITLPIQPLNAPQLYGTVTVGAKIYPIVAVANPLSTSATIWHYAGNNAQLALLDHNSPDAWTTSTIFNIYGSYIA